MDEGGRGGFLGRVAERVVSLVLVLALIGAGISLWSMGPEKRGALYSAIGFTILWLVVVVLLPWSSRFYVRRLLELRTNWAGAALLAVLLVIDAGVGAWLLGWPTGVWGWILSLAALGVAGTYNYLVTEYVAQMSEG